MSNRLYAPQISHYIDWLGHIRYREFNDTTTYDDRSYELPRSGVKPPLLSVGI